MMTIEPPRTVGTLYRLLKEQCETAQIETAPLDARLIVQRALGLDSLSLALEQHRPIVASDWARAQDLLARRMSGEPAAYLLGEKEFWSLPFRVTRDTLIPRPDSEVLVERALRSFANAKSPVRIVDLGTGCGNLLLSILSEIPHAYGVGVDISVPALLVAQGNAERLGLADRACFANGNWADALEGPFDLIISNPPYIESGGLAHLPKEVRQFEPPLALDGGPDGLDSYRRILACAGDVLAADGSIILEVADHQASEIVVLLEALELGTVSVFVDLAGRARCVQATLS